MDIALDTPSSAKAATARAAPALEQALDADGREARLPQLVS